jgi:ribosome-binding protein aMBF1 (putative translation factor)
VKLDKREINVAMAERGLSAVKLAEEIDVSSVTIRRAMQGKSIQPFKAKQIADALELSLREIVVEF